MGKICSRAWKSDSSSVASTTSRDSLRRKHRKIRWKLRKKEEKNNRKKQKKRKEKEKKKKRETRLSRDGVGNVLVRGRRQSQCEEGVRAKVAH